MESIPTEIAGASILIVDDEVDNVRMLERLLGRAGYDSLASTPDPRQARELFMARRPDLVLLDLHMPHMDGFQVMEALAPEIPSGGYVPILVLTGDQDPEVRQEALAAGARDFVTKPFETTEVLLRIKNLLETRFLHLELRDQNELLEKKVRERTRELAAAQVEIVHRLALAAEYRDDVTGQHAERVGILAALIAREMGLDESEVHLIRRAATLHDLGKIGMPDAVLLKPGRLDAEEFEVIKTHTSIGARILSGSRVAFLQMARTIAATHHERWDGQGYPEGLAKEEIPLVGRITAVADVFDSLTQERPYKSALSPQEALEKIRQERERHFDPRVVDAFLNVVGGGRLSDLGLFPRTEYLTRAREELRAAFEDTAITLEADSPV